MTAWVTVSEVQEDSGPMRFIPGSNHWGLLEGSDFHGGDLDAVREGLHLPKNAVWSEEPALISAGGLSLHGSDENNSDGPRCSFAIHLRTQNSRPVDDLRQDLTRHVGDETVFPVIFTRG